MKTEKIFFWLPRVLTIIFILFLGIFALDVFVPGTPVGEMIIGFLIHLVPNYILIVFLLIAWKNEKIGGILFILLSLAFTFFFNTYREIMSLLFISLPVFVIGILFVVNSTKKRTNLH